MHKKCCPTSKIRSVARVGFMFETAFGAFFFCRFEVYASTAYELVSAGLAWEIPHTLHFGI